MGVKCKHCRTELKAVEILEFNFEGYDSWNIRTFDEDNGAVVIRTGTNWCGYELDRQEQSGTIRCPYCHRFPFFENEVNVYEPVELVCFDSETIDESPVCEMRKVTPWTE